MTKQLKVGIGLAAVAVLMSLPIERAAAQVLGPLQPGDLVTVGTEVTGCSSGFTGARRVDAQIKTNGVEKAFSIPAGKLLILTNVSFTLSSTASKNITMRLGVPCGAGCMRSLVDAKVTTDADGKGDTHVSLGNGMAIKSGVEICVADANYGSLNAFATIRGYFTKDD